MLASSGLLATAGPGRPSGGTGAEGRGTYKAGVTRLMQLEDRGQGPGTSYHPQAALQMPTEPSLADFADRHVKPVKPA